MPLRFDPCRVGGSGDAVLRVSPGAPNLQLTLVFNDPFAELGILGQEELVLNLVGAGCKISRK